MKTDLSVTSDRLCDKLQIALSSRPVPTVRYSTGIEDKGRAYQQLCVSLGACFAGAFVGSQGYSNQHKTRRPIRSVAGWTVEYSSALLSGLSFAGLVILLAVRKNRPIFDWHGVTINALVAVLSTVSRASLMFALPEAISQTEWIFFNRSQCKLYSFEVVDFASPDVVGCLVMLWRMQSRQARAGLWLSG